MTAAIIFIVMAIGMAIQSELHRRQMNDLLNRFMARNLTEYQNGKGEQTVNRSKHGNYFLDSMERAYKSKALDE